MELIDKLKVPAKYNHRVSLTDLGNASSLSIPWLIKTSASEGESSVSVDLSLAPFGPTVRSALKGLDLMRMGLNQLN